MIDNWEYQGGLLSTPAAHPMAGSTGIGSRVPIRLKVMGPVALSTAEAETIAATEAVSLHLEGGKAEVLGQVKSQ